MQVGVPGAEHGAHAAAADELLQQHVIELLAFERLAQARAGRASPSAHRSPCGGDVETTVMIALVAASVAVDGRRETCDRRRHRANRNRTRIASRRCEFRR